MVTLAQVKNYCRIDITEDDTLLNGFITAATKLIKEQSGKNYFVGDGSGEPVAIENTEVFQTCVYQLVEHWYDRRGAVDGQQQHHIPYAVDSLIAHFKYSCEYAYITPVAPAANEDENDDSGQDG